MNNIISSTPKSWKIITIAYSIFLATIMLFAYTGILSTKFTHVPQLDKVVHFGLVGFAAFLAHKVLNRKKILNNKVAIGPLIILLLFAIDEYSQKFSPNRSCSIYDYLANVSGVVFFMFLEKRWPNISPTWAIEKMQRACAFLYWQLGRLKEK